MESFQIIGDLHMSIGIAQPIDLPKPTAKYLIITGDIIQAYIKPAWIFYTHCAAHWEKTFIVMGNQEYESPQNLFPISMEYHEAYMRYMIQCINRQYGDKLVVLQREFVDLPDLNIRIAGLTLWADDANLENLRKTVSTPKTTYSLTEEEDTCILRWNLNLHFVKPSLWKTTEFSLYEKGQPPNIRNPFDGDGSFSDVRISQDDLRDLQAKDTAFVERMLLECEQSGQQLIMVSHYIPTFDIIPESPVVFNYVDPFPFTKFCRDMSRHVRSPICAWVCGHIHLKQRSGLVYVNCTNLKNE
jgi:hypothetical protein